MNVSDILNHNEQEADMLNSGMMKKSALLLSLTVFFACNSSTDPTTTFTQFTQQGSKLVGTGTVGTSWQGYSVAISSDGNTAIVGGPLDNNDTGAVWVWTRSGGVWTQQGGKLVGTGASGSANQGVSVAISSDGNTAIVGGISDSGSTGAAWVWTRSGGVWTQQGGKLVGTDVVGSALQGYSVALSSDGNTAIVGGPSDDSYAGAAWVWTRSGGVWTQQGGKLVGTGAFNERVWRGTSVALSSDGNTALVGAYSDMNNFGATWVWTRSGGSWTQQGDKLFGTNAISGSSGVKQGNSVSLSSDGNTAIVGGPGDNINHSDTVNTGASWVWTRSGGVWTQQGSKLSDTSDFGSSVGFSVSLSSDGNTAIIGGPKNNSGVGAAWVWTRSGGVWTRQDGKLVGIGAVGSASQGYSVALSSDGSTAIVGGSGDNNHAGAAWIWSR